MFLHFVVSTDSIQHFYLSKSFPLSYLFHLNIFIQFNSMMFSPLSTPPWCRSFIPIQLQDLPPSLHPFSLLSVPPWNLTTFLSLHDKRVSTINWINFREPHSGKPVTWAMKDNAYLYLYLISISISILPSKFKRGKLCTSISYYDAE